ncbi:hypothetical protein GNI_179170 [Gregarina niphandrodes]|uniref:Uncharacterized protein n=1 Tax=Gregarina niphandrodes TaxID=110365 RepID=A0A023AXD1_GRENI|nr:hypothetical protein GNI_179170 [Gregarina niphandrodes]EZG43267.1 hypothetical protein GNI_179170 [Gregarina niphandrodes]|eukprot:XP_011133477.1 hypothetical protein GNI_179170 [Gregarina niphandrodes]
MLRVSSSRRSAWALWTCFVQGVPGTVSARAVSTTNVGPADVGTTNDGPTSDGRLGYRQSQFASETCSVPETGEGGWYLTDVDEVGWDWSSVSEKDYELYWISRFWLPLDKRGFDLLESRVSARPCVRRTAWISRGAAFAGVVLKRGVRHPWALAAGARPARPNYIPSVGRRRRGDIPDLMGKERSDFEAYQVLHGSIPREAWMRLTTIDTRSFERCRLAYVELACIISAYFSSPYGVVDVSIKDAIDCVVPSTKTNRHRYWTVGCLLQHSGASIKRLAEFCVMKLCYNPIGRRYALQCLRPYTRTSPSRRSDSARLDILNSRLSALPVVLAKTFAQLTQKQVSDYMEQATKNQTVVALVQEPLNQGDWDKALAECLSYAAGSTAVARKQGKNQARRRRGGCGRTPAVGSGRVVEHRGEMLPQTRIAPNTSAVPTRGVIDDETVLLRKRRIPQAYPHLAKKKGTEGGFGSALNGHQYVFGA